ncbi:MAG: dual specificity protein phosphatase family protein [Candidatus Binatia bacterium]
MIRAFQFIISLGKPPPDVSWITSTLAVGGSPVPRQFAGLAQIGIQAVVDLREEARDDEGLLVEHGIRLLHLPVRDHWPPSQSQLLHGTDWVLGQLAAGRKTLLHCKNGVGRSIVLGCCVLMRQGYDLARAVHLVKARRWGVALNRRQMSALKQFGASLNVCSPQVPGEPKDTRRPSP